MATKSTKKKEGEKTQDKNGIWYKRRKFNTLELVIISAWVVLYTALIFILGGVARIFFTIPPFFLIPAFLWGSYLFVLITLIIRKKGTFILFGIPLAILFALSPAQIGVPHFYKALSIIITNAVAEVTLIALHKNEKIATIISGAIIGLFMFLVGILTYWLLDMTPYLNVSIDAAPIMIPAGIILGAIGGFAAYITYEKIKDSGIIMKIRTWG